MNYWESMADVESKIKVDRVFKPAISEEVRADRLSRWGEAVQRSIGFGRH